MHYAFEKLYANQSGQEAWFELPYASPAGALLGHSVGLAGTLLFWLGLGLCVVYPERTHRMAAVGISALGLVTAIVAIVVYHVGTTPSLMVSLLILIVAAAVYGRRFAPAWRDLNAES